MSSTERRDLFGRTESQLREEIARAEGLLEIRKVWRGNDGLSDEIKRAIGQIAVDQRQLAIMLGEMRDDAPRLTQAGRVKQNRELAALDRARQARS